MSGEILVVPAFGQGHLLPCMELCKLIASRNFRTTLVIFSNLSSSVTASFRSHPLIHVLEIPSPPPNPAADFHQHHADSQAQMILSLHTLLSNPPRPLCAIVDVLIMMGWTADIFKKFEVPTIGFFTSGACSAAMELASWKAHPEQLQPGETHLLPGLPEEMALTFSDFKRRSQGGPPRGGGGLATPPTGPEGGKRKRMKMGLPPLPGEVPPWVEDAGDAIGLMINTCDDIERPYVRYLADQLGKPVWGVGPLMPEKYWESAGKILSDREIRTNKKTNVTEDEVIEWLDSKPRGSVLYVSFGSELGPTMEEYPNLAEALEHSGHPFIWVIQPGSGRSGPPVGAGQPGRSDEGFFPLGLSERVGKRGLIIHGWAPQLLILSHPSTGGFLSHCGWNSTVEAIGRGVPFLAWPIRGDQYYDSKLVVSHLKIGYQVSEDMSKTMTKEEIVKGIERLMGDVEMKRRAADLKSKFENGFPKSSMAALDDFRDFINGNKAD